MLARLRLCFYVSTSSTHLSRFTPETFNARVLPSTWERRHPCWRNASKLKNGGNDANVRSASFSSVQCRIFLSSILLSFCLLAYSQNWADVFDPSFCHFFGPRVVPARSGHVVFPRFVLICAPQRDPIFVYFVVFSA